MFSSVKTKRGIYYYQIVDGKKIRVPERDVPDEEKSKKSSTKPKKKVQGKKISKKESGEVKKVKIVKTKKIPKQVKVPVEPQISYGLIRVGQHQRAKSHPSYEGFEKVTAWSRGDKKWKALSPFVVGPVTFTDVDGVATEAPCFENFWQSFKVWKKVAKQNQKDSEWSWPAEVHFENGEPNNKWMKWHKALLEYEKAVRRPNGKAIPEYAYWMNQETGELEHLNIVDARKKIYIPFLKDLYRKTPAYKNLLKMVKGGKNIMIIEPDGPLLQAYPDGQEMNLDLLEELVEKTNYGDEGFKERYRPFGHGYVIAWCLLEDLKEE